MSLESGSPDIPFTQDGSLLAGRYQLLDKLGAGGMGVVFRARDVTLYRYVAVKILPTGKLQDADAVARFRREALALAKLSHPHIIPAHDSGQDGDKHFLVMAWVEGRSLSAGLTDKGRLPPTLAADYVRQAALGLHYAHRLGLVHRDVKPSNLLLGVDEHVTPPGLTLELPRRATLVANSSTNAAVRIIRVPRATIRGFEIRLNKPISGIEITDIVREPSWKICKSLPLTRASAYSNSV